jgi:hypothetical protein
MNAGASAPAPTGADTANEPDEETDFPGAAPAATDQSQGGSPASLPFKIVQVTGGNGGARAEAPRKSQDELMSDFLVSHPKTDEELAQTNAPAQVPAAVAPTQAVPRAVAPAPTAIDNVKLNKYHYSEQTPDDSRMKQANSRIVPRLSAKALLAAAQQLGLTADGKDIYLDDATAGKFRQARSGGLPAALKRSKLENMVLDAANEQQYYVDVNQQ